jgi:uncharacterized protein Smg (DUF494 family)
MKALDQASKALQSNPQQASLRSKYEDLQRKLQEIGMKNKPVSDAWYTLNTLLINTYGGLDPAPLKSAQKYLEDALADLNKDLTGQTAQLNNAQKLCTKAQADLDALNKAKAKAQCP